MGCLGHCIFFALHVLAALTGFLMLFITIPAHLIFAAIMDKKKP